MDVQYVQATGREVHKEWGNADSSMEEMDKDFIQECGEKPQGEFS